LDFYPEFRLNNPYTSAWKWDIPVWVLLPYYSNIIVPIYPNYKEHEFKKRYGLNIDQLLGLEKEKKISIGLHLPQNNEEKISDYLMPLYQEGIDRNIPVFQRTEAFMNFMDECTFRESLTEAKMLFEGKFKELAILIEERETLLEQGAVFDYANLKCLGYSEITENIKNLSGFDPKLAWVALYPYITFLVNPLIESLNGVHIVSKEDISGLDNWSNIINPNWDKTTIGEGYELFPVDVGKSLIDNAQLITPNNLEDSLNIYPDFEKARSVLKDLEIAVEEKKNVIDKKIALEEIWSEINSIELESGKLNTYLEVALGVVGPVTGYIVGDFPGLLAGLLCNIIGKNQITANFTNYLSKFGKSSHIIKIYDFKRISEKNSLGYNRGK